jgi:hypothetical protein
LGQGFVRPQRAEALFMKPHGRYKLKIKKSYIGTEQSIYIDNIIIIARVTKVRA